MDEGCGSVFAWWCRLHARLEVRVAWAILTSVLVLGGPAAVAQNAVTKPYLLSFDACVPDASGCGAGARYSTVYLAQSDDGVHWELVPGFVPFAASVPAVIRRGSTLYLVSMSPTTPPPAMEVRRYHMESGTWDPPVIAAITDAQFPGAPNSPALLLDPEGNLILFSDTYLQCLVAGCTTVHQRLLHEVPGSDGTQFIAQAADVATIDLGAPASAQTLVSAGDLFAFSDGRQYIVYLPTALAPPTPPGMRLYTSASSEGPYVLSTALPNGSIVGNGIAQMAGFYNEARHEYWDYGSQIALPSSLGRAVKLGLGQQVSVPDLAPVLAASALGLPANVTLQHPHFARNWSGGTTVSAAIAPTTLSIPVGGTATAFVTLTNSDTVTAADCFVAPASTAPAIVSYQAVDSATHSPLAAPNTPVPVAGNGTRGTFAVRLTGIVPVASTEVKFTIGCASSTDAPVVSDANTLILSVSPPAAAPPTNYQGLWWASPAGSESGWGVNLTQQGDVIFATWFTYDANGNPMWRSGPATKTGPGAYTGTLAQTRGPAFNAVPFDPTQVTETPVGGYTLTFSDGANGTFAYTVNGISQTKEITREVFVSPGTVCL